jgi:hypothetical protein
MLEPFYSTTESDVDFSKGASQSPLQQAPFVDNFAIRWGGVIKPTSSGAFTFYLGVADTSERVRLTIANTVLLDLWTSAMASTEVSATLGLLSNSFYDVSVNYKNTVNQKGIKLSYRSASTAKQVATTLLYTASTLSAVPTKLSRYHTLFSLSHTRQSGIHPSIPASSKRLAAKW